MSEIGKIKKKKKKQLLECEALYNQDSDVKIVL